MNSAPCNSTAAAQNCCSKYSPNARGKPRSRSPPMSPSAAPSSKPAPTPTGSPRANTCAAETEPLGAEGGVDPDQHPGTPTGPSDVETHLQTVPGETSGATRAGRLDGADRLSAVRS